MLEVLLELLACEPKSLDSSRVCEEHTPQERHQHLRRNRAAENLECSAEFSLRDLCHHSYQYLRLRRPRMETDHTEVQCWSLA